MDIGLEDFRRGFAIPSIARTPSENALSGEVVSGDNEGKDVKDLSEGATEEARLEV
jgi:hypothetical protein